MKRVIAISKDNNEKYVLQERADDYELQDNEYLVDDIPKGFFDAPNLYKYYRKKWVIDTEKQKIDEAEKFKQAIANLKQANKNIEIQANETGYPFKLGDKTYYQRLNLSDQFFLLMTMVQFNSNMIQKVIWLFSTQEEKVELNQQEFMQLIGGCMVYGSQLFSKRTDTDQLINQLTPETIGAFKLEEEWGK